ncbi:MAG: hypothetical protein WCO04_14970 [Pseudomonadota bacterium]
MTTYTAIAETETDPSAPGTSSLWKRWAKNWIAGFEGAAGAPRILGQALASAGDGLAVLTVAAADTYIMTEGAGPETLTLMAITSTDVVAQRYTISAFSGVVRVRASHSVNSAATSTLTLFKNGVSVQVFTTTSSGAVARVVDVAITVGDVLEWRHHVTAGLYQSTVSAISMTGSNAYLIQNAFRKAV